MGSKRYIYCEPGNDGDLQGYTPEQYKYMQTGVNVGNLTDMGWLMQDLPYKKIRSIVVCGVDYKHQVEFPAYAVFNQEDGFFKDLDKYTEKNGVVLYYLPTGDSASEKMTDFDPYGFSSYLRRHDLFQGWNEMFISTCNIHTGRTEPLQLQPPLHTIRGDVVGRCFYDNTPISARDNGTLIYKSLIASSNDVRRRSLVVNGSDLDGSVKFRSDYMKLHYHEPDTLSSDFHNCYKGLYLKNTPSIGALFLGSSLETVVSNLLKIRNKTDHLVPVKRYLTTNVLYLPVVMMVPVSDCLKQLKTWALAAKVDPSDAHAKQKRVRVLNGTETGVVTKYTSTEHKTVVETESITLALKNRDKSSESGKGPKRSAFVGEYKGVGNGVFTKDGYSLFVYTEKFTVDFAKKGGNKSYEFSYFVLAKDAVYEQYVKSQTVRGEKFNKSEQEFIIASNRIDTSRKVGFSQVERLSWYECKDNSKGPAPDKTDITIPEKTWNNISKKIELSYSKRSEVIVNVIKGREVTVRDWIDLLDNNEEWLVRSGDIDWFRSCKKTVDQNIHDWIIIKAGTSIHYNETFKLKHVDAGWAWLQGGSSLEVKLDAWQGGLNKHSFIDEFYCDRSCRHENEATNRFIGYCFQSLDVKSDGTNALISSVQMFKYLESIVFSLNIDKTNVKDGVKLVQFSRLDNVQSIVLNGWHRTRMTKVTRIYRYVREWVKENMNTLAKFGEGVKQCAVDIAESPVSFTALNDTHKRIIASSLNLNINEFTHDEDFGLDKECSAIILTSVTTFSPLEQMEVPKYWLPQSPVFTNDDSDIIIYFKSAAVEVPQEIPQSAAPPSAGSGGGAAGGGRSDETLVGRTRRSRNELYEDNDDINRGSRYAEPGSYGESPDDYDAFMASTRSKFESKPNQQFLCPLFPNAVAAPAVSPTAAQYRWNTSERTAMKPIDIFMLNISHNGITEQMLEEITFKRLKDDEYRASGHLNQLLKSRYNQGLVYKSLIATGFKVCVEGHDWGVNPNHFKLVTNETTSGGCLFKNRQYDLNKGLIVDTGDAFEFESGLDGALKAIRDALAVYVKNKANRGFFSSDLQFKWFNDFCQSEADRLGGNYFNFDGMLNPENVNMGTLKSIIDIYMGAVDKLIFLRPNPKFVELMQSAKRRWPISCKCKWEDITFTTLPTYKTEWDNHLQTYVSDLSLIAAIFNLNIGVVYQYPLYDCNTLIRDNYEIPNVKVFGDDDKDQGLYWPKEDIGSYNDIVSHAPYSRESSFRLSIDLRKVKKMDANTILWKSLEKIGKFDVQFQFNEAYRNAGLHIPVKGNGVNWDVIRPVETDDKNALPDVSGVLNSACPFFMKWLRMGFKVEDYPSGTKWGRTYRDSSSKSRGVRGAADWDREMNGKGKRDGAKFFKRMGHNNKQQERSRGTVHRPTTDRKSEFQQFEGGGGSGHGGGKRTQVEHAGGGLYKVKRKFTGKEKREVEVANWERQDRDWGERMSKGLSNEELRQYGDFMKRYEEWQEKMRNEDLRNRQDGEEDEPDLESKYTHHQGGVHLCGLAVSRNRNARQSGSGSDNESEYSSDEESIDPMAVHEHGQDTSITTYASESTKELYMLNAALGSMAAVAEVLMDNGWATFKIHVGHTEQSRRLATIIRPFFMFAEIYPVSKGYTKHMMFAGKGYRKQASERADLVTLLMSCASLDAYELTKACCIVRDMEIIPKTEFDEFEKKVNRTSGKMFMDWFDHNLAISRVYVQATLEGCVTASLGYISQGVADLLNRLVFTHVSESTRRKNQHTLHDVMLTPYGQQIKPFFVFTAPSPLMLRMSFRGDDGVEE